MDTARIVPPDEQGKRRKFSALDPVWYVLPVVLIPILMIIAALFIVPSNWFVNRSGIPYLANMAYAESLHDQRCQILIYGDSSAMVDVSPAILSAETGLSACNIAEYQGMTAGTRTLMVDEFLRNNPRPVFMVFMFSPDNLAAPSWKYVSFETITYMMRRQRNLHTAKLLVTHPGPTLDWVEHGLRMSVLRIRAVPFSAAVHRQRIDTGGRLPNPLPTRTGCDALRSDVAPDRTWIDELRQRYGVEGTTVLVDATPTAECDPSLAFYRQHLQGFVDNFPYEAIPATSFTGGGRLHANAAGVERISMLLADQIKAQLRSKPGVTSAGAAPVSKVDSVENGTMRANLTSGASIWEAQQQRAGQTYRDTNISASEGGR